MAKTSGTVSIGGTSYTISNGTITSGGNATGYRASDSMMSALNSGSSSSGSSSGSSSSGGSSSSSSKSSSSGSSSSSSKSSSSSIPPGATSMSITQSNGSTVQGYALNGHAYYSNGSALSEGDTAHTAGGDYKVTNGVGVLQSGSSSPTQTTQQTTVQQPVQNAITQEDINKAVQEAIAQIQQGQTPTQTVNPTTVNTALGTALSSAVEVPAALKSLIDAITYNGMSESERQAYANSLASQKYDSTLGTLTSQKGNLDTEAQNALSQIDAQYADRESNTKNLLDEAQSSALKSSIARGGGRAGLVEYLVEKLSKPIYAADQQTLKEQQAKEQAVTNSLNTNKSNVDSQITQTTADKGNYLTSVIQQIIKDDTAASTEANYNKANIMNQATTAAQQGNLAALQTTLPYLAMTAKDKATTDLDYTKTIGTIGGATPTVNTTPKINADTSAGSALMGLRNYLTGKGVAVNWDSSNPNVVTLGGSASTPGTVVSSDTLKSYGGTLDNGAWSMSQDNLDKLLKAYGLYK